MPVTEFTHLLGQPGQITESSGMGHFLSSLIRLNNFRSVVEIGTWNGKGSTACILNALRSKDPYFRSLTRFYTIELYKEMYDVAVQNLSEFAHWPNVKLLYGRIIEKEQLLWFNHQDIDFSNDDHAKLWYRRDIEELNKAPNILHELPPIIDLLILDGGEYSTYPEYELLHDRSRYMLLDDTNVLKCAKIRNELLQSRDHTVIIDAINDRNGWMFAAKNS